MLGSSPQGAPLDRYVVLEYLSEGGMGAIFIGKKLGAGGFEKEVVLKQLLPEFTSQPEFIDLFKREAQLSATLEHANIVKTIDLVTAGADFFIVMEYVHGADLRTLLKRAKRWRQRVSAKAAIYVASELLSALAYAHNRLSPDGQDLDLIHRDISPSNILISGNGEVKLTDFGIAKASTHNSGLYRVKGKVGYMSPEQARSEPLDQRSDLYSLAVCLYETLTGERLFVVAGLTTSAEEIYSQPVPKVSRKVSGTPKDLDDVMFRALAKNPEKRYQTAGEFREALLRCAHRHGLLMSAPELASHLRQICGGPESWRDPEADNPAVRARSSTAAFGQEGTEIIDGFDEGTLELDASEMDDDELMSLAHQGDRLDILNEREKREKRALTSMTSLTRLRGIELTSMFDISEMQSGLGDSLLDDSLDDPLRDPPGMPSGMPSTEMPTMSLAPAPNLPLRADPSEPMVIPPDLDRVFDSLDDSIDPHQTDGQQPLTAFGRTIAPRNQPSSRPISRPQHAPSPRPISRPQQQAPVPRPNAFSQSAPSPRPLPSAATPSASSRAQPGRRLETIDGDGDDSGDPHHDQEAAKSKRKRSRAWIILIIILLVGIAAAAAIGLSGPQLIGGDSDEPSQPSAKPPSSAQGGATAPATEATREAARGENTR